MPFPKHGDGAAYSSASVRKKNRIESPLFFSARVKKTVDSGLPTAKNLHRLHVLIHTTGIKKGINMYLKNHVVNRIRSEIL